MKTFLLGLLAGIILYAAGDALLHRSAPAQAKVDVPSEMTAPKPMESAATAPVTARVEHAASSQVPVAASDCVPVDEEHLDKAVSELMERRHKLEQASLEAEPKDPLWSDAMEQQLRLFMTRDPRSTGFVIKKVDCRTVYCAIDAEGPWAVKPDRSDDPQRAFVGVLDEVQKQLGLMKGEWGNEPSGNPNTQLLHARLRRFKPGEQCPAGFPNCEHR